MKKTLRILPVLLSGLLTLPAHAVSPVENDQYDAVGHLTQRSDGANHITGFSYDPLGRLLQLTKPDAGVVTLSYDGQDHVTQVTDPVGQTTEYTWDAWGDVLKTVSPDTGTTTRTYDAAGNVLTVTDALGHVTTYTYDALNRVVTKHSNVRGTPSYRFGYDHCENGVGRLCAVFKNGRPSQRFAYDSQGRLAERATRLGERWLRTAYTYHPGGQLASLTYPDGRVVAYRYDMLGRVSEVDALSRDGRKTVLASGFSYAPFGGAVSYTFGNGLSYAQALDLDYRPTVQQSGPWVKSASYDAAGNLATLKNVDGTEQSFGYDAVDRLTQAADTAVGGYGSLSYTYDLNGNRTSATQNAATTGYTYSPANWLAQAGNDNRLRNADGDTAYADSLGTLRYDGYGRLIEVDRHGAARGPDDDRRGEGGIARYRYDAFGERVAKQAQDQATYFSYGPNHELLAEQNEDGRAEDYVWLNGKLLARLDNGPGHLDGRWGRDEDRDDHGAVYYYHTDSLGTPQAMTDAKGKAVWQASYTPFGQARVTIAKIENDIRFPGQYYDKETGLNYNLNRDYDPTIGRYVEADPLGLAAGTNVYTYVGGNPISLIDPTGKIIIDPEGRLSKFGRAICLLVGLCGDPKEPGSEEGPEPPENPTQPCQTSGAPPNPKPNSKPAPSPEPSPEPDPGSNVFPEGTDNPPNQNQFAPQSKSVIPPLLVLIPILLLM